MRNTNSNRNVTCQQLKISLVQPSLHELQLQFCLPFNINVRMGMMYEHVNHIYVSMYHMIHDT